MNLEDFIKNFADQLEETDPKTIKASTSFKDIEEWSSLTTLSVMAMIAEEYDVALTGDDFERASTVEELFNIVKTNL